MDRSLFELRNHVYLSSLCAGSDVFTKGKIGALLWLSIVSSFIKCQVSSFEVMLGKLMLAQQMPRVHVSAIMSHKRPSSQPPPGSKQIRLEALMKGRMTKTALVSVLQDLHQAGLLEQRFNIKQVRKAVRAHSTAQTPYGSVIKRFEFDARFEYIDPAALLYYLCTVSDQFAEMIAETVNQSGGRCLKWVLYQDGVIPGNPFRPDKARKVEAWYWIIVEFPDFVIQRSACWPVATLIRTAEVATIPGGISTVCRHLLNIFEIFAAGVALPTKDGTVVLRCEFAGFLADLLAHKEIQCSKGTGGIRLCTSCANVSSRDSMRLDAGEVNLSCCNPDQFLLWTDAELFHMVDLLHDAVGTRTKGQVEALETVCGFNVCADGIMQDKAIRRIYSPVSHTLRDWMHMLSCDGLANTETGLLLHAMANVGITLEMVQTFFGECTLPQMHGKVSKEWVAPRRLKGATLSSFASIMLSVLPIMQLMLEHYNIASMLPQEVRCYEMLCSMVSILRLSPSKVPKLVPQLKEVITQHHRLFIDVHGAEHLKPKSHHMFHVVDGVESLGKCLSCFVCERKHREVKASAVHVFRHFEATTLRDMLNSQVNYLIDGHDLFRKQFLSKTRLDEIDTELGKLHYSTGSAICHVGEVFVGDILFLHNGIVLEAIAFLQFKGGDVVVQGKALHAVTGSPTTRSTSMFDVMFCATEDIADVCIYFSPTKDTIKINVPPHVLHA